jgi:ABC-2 type transport system ATP-binding protein
MSDEIAIKVDHVSKNFVLPHDRVNSIKGLFTSAANKRNKTKQANETQHALKDISFEIKKGEFFGIVGRNGSGKSTMLKILAGIYQPTTGSVTSNGKLVPFIELGVGFNPELTGRENVFLNGAMLGFSEDQVSAMYEEIVAFAELERFMDQKLKNYSSGMQVRLAFSMATRSEADILLVDEILAVGDADFQRKCFDYFQTLKGSSTTVVFVTHDMNAVREYCDKAILIEQSELVVEGTPSKVAASYTRMFMEQNVSSAGNNANQRRWGDEALRYVDVSVMPKRVTPDVKDIVITAKAEANKDIENPLFGFLIKNAAEVQILGTNNDIERQTVSFLKKGETIEMQWSVPNIFNDGVHFIDPAIVYKGGHQVADWWEEAASFKVLREDKTGYLTSPPLRLTIKRESE